MRTPPLLPDQATQLKNPQSRQREKAQNSEPDDPALRLEGIWTRPCVDDRIQLGLVAGPSAAAIEHGALLDG